MGSRFSHTSINKKWRKSFNWILLSAITAGIIVSGCQPRMVRSGHRYQQTENEKAQDVKTAENNIQNAEEDNPLLAELQEYEQKVMANNDNPDGEFTEGGNTVNEPPRIPTLREQVKSLKTDQTEIKSKVTGLEGDVEDIKKTLDDIKFELQVINGKHPREAVAGAGSEEYYDVKTNKQPEKVASNIILPDEDVAKKQETTATKRSVAVTKKTSKPKKKSQPAFTLKNESKREFKKEADKPEPVESDVADNQVSAESTYSSGFSEAMNAFRQKKYHKAIIELSNIARNESNPSLVGKYNYWLGEAHFGLKQYSKALGYFNKSLSSGNHSKKDASVVMIAESNIRTGKVEEAKKAFNRLLTEYPNSRYVPRARKMLQQL